MLGVVPTFQEGHPMRFRTVVTISVLALSATWGSAVAQVPTPPGIPQHQAAIHTLRDSQMVRLHTSALARREGRLLSHDENDLMLAQGTDSLLNISVRDVDSLWVRGTSWKTGALIGSVLGAAAGVVLGLGVSELGCESTDCGPAAGAGLAGGAIVGAGGALLGALIGSAFPKWHSRWP